MSDPIQNSKSDKLRLGLDLDALPHQDDNQRRGEATPTVDSRLSIAPAAGAGYGSGSMPNDEIHLVDYLRVLHKRRFTAITAFLIVFGSVTIYTFVLTPIYSARVQILIENENPNVVKFEEVYEQNKTTNDYYQTQYRILQSRLIAKRTINAEKLWDHPVLNDNEQPAPIRWVTAAVGWVGGLFGTTTTREIPSVGESANESRVIDIFLKKLVVSPVRNSRLVDVTFRSPDPQLSARVANALGRQYIEQNLEFKYLATKEATDFLNARTAEQRKVLEQSEQALQKYRERTGAVALEDRQNIVVQRLADLNAAVTRARTDRIEKESVYNQIRGLQNDRASLDTFPAILNNAFIQQLKAQQTELQRQRAQLSDKLGERHPEMLKVQSAIESTETRINAEVQKVVQALRNDFQAAAANERALQQSLNQQRTEAQELNRASIQYGVLQRDAASNQSMFSGLLERSRETGISGELKTSNIRIVDPAEVPRRPSSPNKLANLSMALLGGSLLGIALAFFFEYLDSRIKQPEELKAQLGLPFLGMVPAFLAKETTGPPLIGNGMPQEFNEAFRGIRTNVLFSSAESGSKSIVITSTEPGEGKSVVSANVAMSLALAGQRVLLIDADMRRPKLHEFFGASHEPGLSNVMVGNSKASETVKKTLTPNLWLMAAGKNPPNPAELLGSKRFREFMLSLTEHFDWIIIDSPPVMAVTDASIIAHGAAGVIFVVGSEMTSKGAAKAALEQLDSAKAKYVGGILNRVDIRRNAYYYSRYYRREYANYYTKREAR
ncbi:MAG: polysaccharide biosynthesis tyrosine autokinase [Cyanobacteria bacterium]|nr:polysaccharide biosynthesis tyrosine autokinase [Cyanobacteriota bacterium]